MGEGADLWDKFKTSFLAEVRSLDGKDRTHFWSSRPNRTTMYTSRLLPSIARKLKLEYCPDVSEKFFRIDGLFTDHSSPHFPRIWLESENDPRSTELEMDKLCYVRSPLKVLITVDEWPHDHLKETWLKYIRESWNWWHESADTVYGFIVGEAKNSSDGIESLLFHCFSVSAEGNAGPEEKELIGDLLP